MNTYRVRKKTEAEYLSGARWRPSATIPTLRRRAEILRVIRRYFADTNVLEVATPLLMPAGSPDPALNSFIARPHAGAHMGLSGFLQTSPEFAMKRLLAAGSGDIYQLCHAFRAEELGRYHLAEFTLLEWYRLGFDHHRLMDDVEALALRILPSLSFARCSYGGLFHERLGIDPHGVTTNDLAEVTARCGIELGEYRGDRAMSLDALFAYLFRDDCSPTGALFVYDFPLEQAAYARIDPGPPRVAQRFELLIGGIEIANGYYEVIDPVEQQGRHTGENSRRRALGLPEVDPDPLFLAALEYGLPECAGVAMGVERLMMSLGEHESVASVVSFDAFDTAGQAS